MKNNNNSNIAVQSHIKKNINNLPGIDKSVLKVINFSENSNKYTPINTLHPLAHGWILKARV